MRACCGFGECLYAKVSIITPTPVWKKKSSVKKKYPEGQGFCQFCCFKNLLLVNVFFMSAARNGVVLILHGIVSEASPVTPAQPLSCCQSSLILKSCPVSCCVKIPPLVGLWHLDCRWKTTTSERICRFKRPSLQTVFWYQFIKKVAFSMSIFVVAFPDISHF